MQIGNETHEAFQMIVDTIDEITFPSKYVTDTQANTSHIDAADPII